MITTRTTRLELEIAKWLLLFGLAAALSLALASQVSGVSPPPPLPLTPPDRARSLDVVVEEAADDYEVASRMWTAVEQHRQGRLAAARDAWKRVPVTRHTVAWRLTALANVARRTGRLSEGITDAVTARTADINNPVAAFELGMLSLDQAERSAETRVVRRVSAGPATPIEVDPRMYRLSARMALEDVVRLAPGLSLEDSVLGVEWVAPPGGGDMGLQSPSVADLLEAFGDVEYVATAQLALASLAMERGDFAAAEAHVDAAFGAGADASEAYAALAWEHERAGDRAAAARAYFKALRQSGDRELIREALRNAVGQEN